MKEFFNVDFADVERAIRSYVYIDGYTTIAQEYHKRAFRYWLNSAEYEVLNESHPVYKGTNIESAIKIYNAL
jgi:hypothetical protein